MRRLIAFEQVSLDGYFVDAKGDLAAEVRRMKNESGPGMAILGSGSIVSQLAQAGLIDEFQMVVNPIVLGKGRTLFEGVKESSA